MHVFVVDECSEINDESGYGRGGYDVDHERGKRFEEIRQTHISDAK